MGGFKSDTAGVNAEATVSSAASALVRASPGKSAASVARTASAAKEAGAPARERGAAKVAEKATEKGPMRVTARAGELLSFASLRFFPVRFSYFFYP